MAERITPEKGLDLKTTRKPMDWSECAVLLNPTKGQEDYLKGLSLFPCGDDHSPMTDLVKPAADGYLIRMPQRFLAKHKGAYYYVNTEGYSYCRYGLRVPASLFDANEPVQELAPAPILEDEAAGKTKNLVLAAKVMVGWLELHDYPAKTKALAKALQDAIDEA